MGGLREKLIDQLHQIPGVDVHLHKPDSSFMVIDYEGKGIAHFHGSNELDIRLSKAFVKSEGLTNSPDRVGHPDRKNGGAWLIVRFTRESHLAEMVRLIKKAIELRQA